METGRSGIAGVAVLGKLDNPALEGGGRYVRHNVVARTRTRVCRSNSTDRCAWNREGDDAPGRRHNRVLS